MGQRDEGGPAQLVAYVDESMLELTDGTGMAYFLAAAVIYEASLAPTRANLRALLLGREPRLHWTKEFSRRKSLIMRTVSTAEVECVVVVGSMARRRQQERARRQVMKHLLWELDQMDVRWATLESRGAAADRRDLAVVGGLRNGRHLSRRLAVNHEQPIQEPLLWIADAVAGAAGDHRCGDPRYYRELAPRVREIDAGGRLRRGRATVGKRQAGRPMSIRKSRPGCPAPRSRVSLLIRHSLVHSNPEQGCRR